MRPEIAVVIATWHRPDLLERCLRALLRQNVPGEIFEIIVVDDGPDEATRDLVGRMSALAAGEPAVRYLRNIGGRGPASARNRGWQASAAPLIAFTDDDTVPEPNWLHQGQLAMSAGLVAARGRVRVPWRGPPTDHARNTQGLETAEFVTANAFVRHEALVSVGGFDERFTRAWREDSDLHFSLLEAGGQVGLAERAVVLHPVRAAPWGISLSQQANVVFDALLYRKHPELFRSKVRSKPPLNYLLIVGLSLAAAVAAVFGSWWPAQVCASGAVLGIALFAAKRLRGASHSPAHVAEMVVTSFAIPYLALGWRVVGSWRYGLSLL